MTTRRFFLHGCLACVLVATPLSAQDRPPEPPQQPMAAPADSAPAPRTTDKPAPTAGASTREFRPSEDVSPDQEVDFPADL
jgi:hypothetical protein